LPILCAQVGPWSAVDLAASQERLTILLVRFCSSCRREVAFHRGNWPLGCRSINGDRKLDPHARIISQKGSPERNEVAAPGREARRRRGLVK
jgi:hypothetical protein